MVRSFMEGRISFGAPKLYLVRAANRRHGISPRTETSTDAKRWSAATRQVAALVLLGLVARLVLAAVLGLGVDESYEVVLSRVPSLGYFDHPPLSFWIPALVAQLTGSEHRVLLRLPFIVLFAVTTILVYRLTARLYGERAGVRAALLLNVTPVFTGGWILPDGPLACAIAATAWCLTHVLLEPSPRAWRWWIGAGITTGVALLSKYHGVFLLAGVLLFIITRRESRSWVRRPEPYLATVIALALATPVLVWNAQHDFASIRFQAGRATTHGIQLASLMQNVAGQLGYLLPWIGVPLAWQLGRGLRAGPRDAPRWLLCCLAVGPIAVFTLVSLGGKPGLPHWPAPGYLLLFPLLGDAVSRYESRGPRERNIVARFITAAVAVFLLLVTIAASDVATGWVTRTAPRLFARGDPSLEAVDWGDLKPALSQRSLLNGGQQVVIATHWIDAAKIGYALGRSIPVLCFSDDPRGFQFAYPPRDFVGRDAIILVRIGRGAGPIDVAALYSDYFQSITPADTIPIRRAGRVEIALAVFRGHDLLRAYGR